MRNLYAISGLCISMLFASVAFGQMRHVPGDLLIQFDNHAQPQQVIEEYQEFMGMRTDLSLGELLSAHMNIYLVHFRPDFLEERALLEALRRDEGVSLAQFNHYIKQRDTILPNDENFSEQWHHLNLGQTGGTPGADVGSTKAWDITTGGRTATGDSIVVCIIEGGNLNHPDLAENAWRNWNEIPGNGIDDDENGYIDDFEGWNVNTGADSPLSSGTHGTQVMGMIGARGDNGIGAAGINWDVKLMAVRGQQASNEASVVAAYTYPLVMRKLYNESDGARGAFVVATNASWGIDNGNIDDVPIWNAFYDTLGVYGILNCGATANNNVDVDVVGDIPTASPSPYMVSVTATNHNDQRTFSAYGATTIDVAAPGENVYTTTGNQGYGTTSGTSFASPLTAGIIALMYSVPCPSFMDVVKSNPQLGADYVRYALLEGVDPVESLQNFIITGGRVNAYNSVKILMDNCGEDICLPPFSFDYSLSDDTLYQFNWNAFEGQSVTIRYKAEEDEDWTVLSGISVDEFSFVPAELCTNYIFEIASDCSASDPDSLIFGSQRVFESKGCCIAPFEAEAMALDSISAEVSWESTFALSEYAVYIRPTSGGLWEWIGNSEEEAFNIAGLSPCTFYDVSVVPTCEDNPDQGNVMTIRTKGCGQCIDGEYCDSRSEGSNFEWIQAVTIGDFNSTTGNNGGYLFTEDWGAEFEVGTDVDLSLSPGFSFFPIGQIWSVWVDLNQDGSFSEDELLFSTESAASNTVNGNFTIPMDATLGTTRMRIAMKRAVNPGTTVAPCEEYNRGETEDYCIELLSSTLSTSAAQVAEFNIFPNPGNGSFQYQLNISQAPGVMQLQVFDLTGKLVAEQQLQEAAGQIDLRKLDNGMYLYNLRSLSGSMEYKQSGKVVIAR